QMGESIAEGTVSKWLKQVGDAVKRDEPLFEISTDKVDAEIPAPAAGVLAEIKVQQGQTVPVQTLVAVIETAAGAAAAAAPAAPVPLPAGAGVQHPAVEPWPGDRVEPFSKIRKITADHMIMSRRVSAHVTSFFEVDYSKIAELRRRHKASSTERGVKLTYLAFIAKACAEQLRAHPVVNAAVSGDNIIYRRDVNIGIAVALEWGLIVPVVKHADELSLLGLARAINDLGERA